MADQCRSYSISRGWKGHGYTHYSCPSSTQS